MSLKPPKKLPSDAAPRTKVYELVKKLKPYLS